MNESIKHIFIHVMITEKYCVDMKDDFQMVL